jgi:HD-like signal output (HDOD) protein/signal transduction histidine kinase
VSDRPLLSRIEASRNLPSLPHILLQLIDVCNRPDKGIRELAKVINQDPSLSERILRLVNSAYYSLKQKISSIDQALLLLGMDAVKNIAISSSVYQVFNRPARKSAFDLKLFWWHSLSCAVIARILARKTQYHSPDEAFLAGLLHDIGKIVLWVNFEQEYERLLKSSGPRGAALLEAERRLGSTHAEAGAWLIRRWDLRSFLPDALLYHHDPPERVLHSFPLVQIVFAANLLCPTTGEIAPEDLAAAKAVLGLEPHQLKSAAEEGAAEVRETARSLEIEITAPRGEETRGEATGGTDQAKAEELAGLVRDLSLIQGFSETLLKAQDKQGVLQVLRQAVHLLLDVPSVFYFEYEPPPGPRSDPAVAFQPARQPSNGPPGAPAGPPSGGALAGLTTGVDDLSDVIRELRIPFQEQSSLLVRALVQHKALDTFARDGSARDGSARDAGLSILDEQLVRFLGAEGMLCLPLQSGQAYVGVLLLGLDRRQREALAGKRRLLSMIVSLSTLALHGARMREWQLQRVREERFGAVSEMARRIVHEAHNPLGIVTNYLSILAGKLTDNEAVQEDLRIVREEIRRVSQIIGELSSFSDPAASRHEAVDVNGVLKGLSRIAGAALEQSSSVKLALKLENKLPAIRSDGNRLKQVFLNLLKNAAEAMPSGGTITFESRRVEMEPLCIEVSVRDEGGGIPEEIGQHLFEPFHSTKGQEGIGLSIVYGIMRDLGGSISYDTSAAGTVFRLRLPV